MRHVAQLLVLLGSILTAIPSVAATGAFIPVQIGEDARVEPASLGSTIQRLGAARPAPRHVVVLVHGFNTTPQRAQAIYAELALRIRAAFTSRGQSLEVLGVFWPSAAGGNTRWIKKTVLSKLFKSGTDPYREKATLARAIGLTGFRELLIALKAKLPRCRLHIFAHSLGGEITACAVKGADPDSPSPDPVETFDRSRRIQLDLVCLAGADVDQNQTHASLKNALPKLIWITTAVAGMKRDQALLSRRLVRGERAIGSTLPTFTVSQLDKLLNRRGLVLDTDQIPRDHDFAAYFGTDRIDRLADAALTLADPSCGRSELLAEIKKVVTAPAKVAALKEFLDSEELSVVYYALWRLDRLLCGSCCHLSDGTLRKAMSLARRKPDEIRKARASSPCRLISSGLFPPPCWGTGEP